MTRIFTDGAEFQDLLFWNTTSSTSVSTGQYRSGLASYYIASSAKKDITAVSELYLRFAVRANNMSGTILRFYKGTNVIGRIDVDGTSKFIKAYAGDGSTLLGTGSTFLSTVIWYLIEIRYKVDDASGVCHVYVDGIEQVNFSGDTKPAADTTIDGITFYSIAGDVTYYDDLAMNDTAGGDDDSWCGDGHIELLRPNDNGDTNNWTGSDGDTTNNYLLVDEFPSDSDTTYVKSSTASQQDMYDLSDYTDTGKIVTRIYAECRAKDNDVTGGQIKLGFKTDGTVYLCSSARTLTGNYTRIVGDDAKVNPFDSGTWENADLDAIQFVVECE